MTSRTVLVVGASRGIGWCTAQRLAAAGHRVIGWSRNMPEDEFPGTWMRCDIADEAAVVAAVEEILAAETVDCLVNNAGLPSSDRFGEIPLEQLRSSFEFHARACLQTMQAFAPGMKERGWGRIVNVLSTSIHGVTERTCYRAGKEAASSLTISAALELAPYGITVNAVVPGPVPTAALRGAHAEDSPGERFWKSQVPMRRFGTVEEIAVAIEFFLGERASYVTGQRLFVDGGLTAGTVIEL